MPALAAVALLGIRASLPGTPVPDRRSGLKFSHSATSLATSSCARAGKVAGVDGPTWG
jgi:hypothetical protein